jgi:hypothetical protein
VSGTESGRLADVIRALTVVGAICFVGWGLFVFWVVNRVRRTGASRIAGVWEERLDQLAFLVLPPNVPVLAMAAAAAATATYLAGPTQELGLAVLLRLIRWSANALVVVGVASAVVTLITDTEGPDRIGTVAFRLGGAALAAGISYVCLSVGRTAPGG